MAIKFFKDTTSREYELIVILKTTWRKVIQRPGTCIADEIGPDFVVRLFEEYLYMKRANWDN